MKYSSRILTIVLLFGIYSCAQKKKEPTIIPLPTHDSTTAVIEEPMPNTYPSVDISPMDMSYFPVDYPKLKMAKSIETPPLARVIYSRPHLQGRSLFPDILKYGEPWRLGANEATELQLFANATIQGKRIAAGRYILYCIPRPANWTIVFNSNIDTWGLHTDSTKDFAKFVVPAKQTTFKLEYFSIAFEKTNAGCEMLMAWDQTEARLPIEFE